jgi:tetratricopeptide (TPR) repeat protein
MPHRILTDRHGLTLSTRDAQAVRRYDAALALLNRFDADPLAEIDAALAETPDFVMGHAFRAGLMVMGCEPALLPALRESLDAAEALAGIATEREFSHIAAARAWADGAFQTARRRYGEIVARWPRDVMALQVAHQLDFFLGDQAALRDRPRAALRAFSSSEPAAGHVRGMLAFGLEECGEYDAAEEAGQAAVAQDPRDAWAIHAVAHVLEMQGRTAEGAAWLAGREPDWTTPGNMLAVHNWWHLALFHLDRGERAQALDVFDRGVRRREAAPAIELVDVSAMLWRFMLLGIDAGAERWAEAARLWEAQEPGFYAFSDCHAVMAFLGAGRGDQARAVIAAMQRATKGEGSNAAMTREVGLPLALGLLAFAEGRHAEAAHRLAPLPLIAQRFGGSHAQRDVIALTRLEATLRAGDREQAAWLASARLAARPESVMARGLAARVARLHGCNAAA